MSLSEYVAQREAILLAEDNRILDRVCAGDLVDADEIDDRLATLEVFHHRIIHELEKGYKSARHMLVELRKTRLSRLMNVGEADVEVAAKDENPSEKGDVSVPLFEYLESLKKGDAGVPLVESAEAAQNGDADTTLIENGYHSTRGCVGVPISDPASELTRAPAPELDQVEQAEAEAIQAEANNLPLEPTPPPAAVRSGPAVWHAFDGDQDVIVTGDWGVVVGRRFVSIEGSSRGIPFDAISYSAHPDESKPKSRGAAATTPAGVEGSGSKGSPAEPTPDEEIYFPPGSSDEEAEIERQKGDVNVPLVDSQEITEKTFSETANLTLQGALEYVAAGIAVFPLHTVKDGICSCPKGSECKNAGKHPRWHRADLPNGVENATTDPAQIKNWFERWPDANLAIAMGGALRLIAMDSDPRNGGDASVCDLVEAHGDGWLNTHTVRTGGNGNHFLYRLPEGVEVHKGKIAPGIDVKAAGGYLVAPPSVHASGRKYEVEKNVEIAVAPDWLIEELTRAPEAQPSKVVNFQERSRKVSSSSARYFEDGERNNGLRDVACGRWLNGWATDAQDLFEQLRVVRDTRCAPGKKPPPSDAELYELAVRTTQKFARGTLRSEIEGSP